MAPHRCGETADGAARGICFGDEGREGIRRGMLQNEGHLTYRQHRPYLEKVGGLLAAAIDTAGQTQSAG